MPTKKGLGKTVGMVARVADPHHFDADPNPAFYFNADRDPAFHFNADPDPAFHFYADSDPDRLQSDVNLRLNVYRPSRVPF
jgi:hypothetical protein